MQHRPQQIVDVHDTYWHPLSTTNSDAIFREGSKAIAPR